MEMRQNEQADEDYPDHTACKVFVNRIPASFTEESVRRLVESGVTTTKDAVVHVELAYTETPEEEVETKQQQHKGYAFVQMKTPELANTLIEQQTLKGTATPNSKKKHTIYVSSAAAEKGDELVCFLWQQGRCPYREGCKFQHTGTGACLAVPTSTTQRKRKCWEFMKKGSCPQGDSCPFLHTTVTKQQANTKQQKRPDSEKDCINWKTKGKCRKQHECPYRHDETVREQFLAKKNNKKKRTEEEQTTTHHTKKQKQPLSVRVFGLNYDTTQADVRTLLEPCGTITDITFPTFADSGRSKGYCEVLFASPKAVQQAVRLHETELHGRWLSIQAGRMLEEQWQ